MNVVIQVAVPKTKDLPSKAFIKKVLNIPSPLAGEGGPKGRMRGDLHEAPPHPSLRDSVVRKGRRNSLEVLVRIVTPQEMQELNHQYRQKNAPTNVLAFPEQSLPGLEPASLGDIIICHEIIKTEAAAQHKFLEDHYAHMLIHGFLHLLGYDHIKTKDAEIMEQLEIKLLHKLNIRNPYEEIP